MKRTENFVKSDPMQLAIREVQSIVQNSSFWVGFFCVLAVLTVSAPFDSGEEFNLPQRFCYWLGICIATFFPAMLVIRSLSRRFVSKGLGGMSASLLSGLISGVPVGLIVFGVNSYIAGNDNGELKDVSRLIFLCAPIAVAVAGLQYLLIGLDRQKETHSVTPKESTLMSRLSYNLRGTILSLQSQDHYVEVVTSAGQELLLMRLADAISEVKADGFQVHRSWWVAREAVANLIKTEGRHELLLHDGRRVPVSRSNQKTVLAWLDET